MKIVCDLLWQVGPHKLRDGIFWCGFLQWLETSELIITGVKVGGELPARIHISGASSYSPSSHMGPGGFLYEMSVRRHLYKVHGCYLVWFLCSATSANKISTTKRVLHYHVYDATFAKSRLKIGPPLIWVWLWDVHLCWLLKWIHMSSQLCSLLSVIRVVIDIWRRSPIPFKHVSLWCLLFDPHQTTYQSNVGGLIKKWAT